MSRTSVHLPTNSPTTSYHPILAAVPSSTLPLMTVDLVGPGLRAYRDSAEAWMGLGLVLLPDCIRSLTSTISNAKRQMRVEHVMQTPATRSTWRNEFHQWAGRTDREGAGLLLIWMSDKVSTANGSRVHTPPSQFEFHKPLIFIWLPRQWNEAHARQD